MTTRPLKRKNLPSSDGGKPRKKSKHEGESPGFYRWDDKGTMVADGSVEHNRLEVTTGKRRSIIMVGDTVLLQNDDTLNTGATPGGAFVARVERMWEDLATKRTKPARMRMRARWYFKKKDVEALGGDFTGPISREDLLSNMGSHDLVLSNQFDDNDVDTILRRCIVITRQPSGEEPPPLPPDTFLSSYRISFGTADAPGTAVLTAYDGDNDEWPGIVPEYETLDGEHSATSRSEVVSLKPIGRRRAVRSPSTQGGFEAIQSQQSSIANEASSSSTSSDDDSTQSEGSTEYSQEEDIAPETEGSTLIGNISIGPDHQVRVPPFVPGQTVPSRNPTLLWKPGSITQEILDRYLEDASKILNDYMEQNGLVVDDPYAPLPSARVEAMMQAENNGESLTLSRLSTASSLSSTHNKLTRECKIDALLTALNQHNYNPEEALSAVAASPRNYLTIWTKKEKDLFNSVFRRDSGSLRMISKAVAGSKTFKDVVDYHYRFKIPEQFRRYQEKKREQAIRMMECVEHRRSFEAPVLPRDAGALESRKHVAKASHGWHKTGVSDVTHAVEERRLAARDLFLQVQAELGTQTLNELASAVKSLKDGSIEDLKETFVDLLREQPELLDRFLAFLPKRFREGVSARDLHAGSN